MAGALTFRPLRRHETDAAARIHSRGRATLADIAAPVGTPAQDRTFYRDRVFVEGPILGAFVDGELAGQLAWQPGWIDHFYVDPLWQSRGIGSQLIERIKARHDDVQLWTFQANARARRFYERHGFVAEEFTDGAQNDEREPDVRYRWRR